MAPSPEAFNWICAAVRQLQADVKTLKAASPLRKVVSLVDELKITGSSLNADAPVFVPALAEPDVQVDGTGVNGLEEHALGGRLQSVEVALNSVNETLDSMQRDSVQEWHDIKAEFLGPIASEIGHNVASELSSVMRTEFCRAAQSDEDHPVGPRQSFHDLFLPLLPAIEKFLHLDECEAAPEAHDLDLSFEEFMASLSGSAQHGVGPLDAAGVFEHMLPSVEQSLASSSHDQCGPYQLLAADDVQSEVMAMVDRIGMCYPPGCEHWRECAKVVKDHVAKHSLHGDLSTVANEIFETVMNLLYGSADGLSDCDFLSDSDHDL